MKNNMNSHAGTVCKGVVVDFDKEQRLYFVDEADVKEYLFKSLGDSIKGDKLGSLNLMKIESAAEKNPYVRDAETFIDAAGNVHVSIAQKQPLARVINKNGVNYYIDERENKIPVTSKFTCRVIVVTGNIEEGIQKSKIIESATLKNVLRLTHYIHSNAFWNAQIEQIAVTNENEFQLVPKIGNHIIEFGAAENIEEKFSKLQTFYKEGLNYVGWNNYKTINLKFDNQVVCTKHTEYEEHN